MVSIFGNQDPSLTMGNFYVPDLLNEAIAVDVDLPYI